MSIRGEIALPKLIKKMEQLSGGAVLIVISRNLSEEAIELTKQGFEDERDPYGNPWAPIKHRKGKILQDTAIMKNSFFAGHVGEDGFRFGTNVQYAGYHQTGTKRIAKRMMVPEGALPKAWADAFEEAANEILVDFFKT